MNISISRFDLSGRILENGPRSANNTQDRLAAGIVTNNLDIVNTMSIWRVQASGFDLDKLLLRSWPKLPIWRVQASGFDKNYGIHIVHKYLQNKSIVNPLVNAPSVWLIVWVWVGAPYYHTISFSLLLHLYLVIIHTQALFIL